MDKSLQEIITFYLQWPYEVPKIVINYQLTKHSLTLARYEDIKQ